MLSTQPQQTTVSKVSLDTLLSTFKPNDIQFKMALALPPDPKDWTLRFTGIGDDGKNTAMFDACYNPTDLSAPYEALGKQLGINPHHPIYATLEMGGRFPVEELIDWVNEAEIELKIEGMMVFLGNDQDQRAQDNAPYMDPRPCPTKPYPLLASLPAYLPPY